MTKNSAHAEMEKGVKMTHTSFTDEEWITIENERYVFEDGCSSTFGEFWRWRKEPSWFKGWSIYKSN